MHSETNANTNKHAWQKVGIRETKRLKTHHHTPVDEPIQLTTTNRFHPLADYNDNTSTNNASSSNATNTVSSDPKPPPIYVYGITDYKGMIDNLALVVDDETYHTISLPNLTVKIIPHTSDTYRKLIHHIRSEDIIHHTYQLKQDRAYRVVIRGLHHSTPLTEISVELAKLGFKVRNIINARHRVTKQPLPLFFIDLEPQKHNTDIFNLKFLMHSKISVEPPKQKTHIIQCTRCQAYGHSKTYCNRPHNCVKCGQPHDTKICTKTRQTPAKCALCAGNHPANYKGCTVYLDLTNARNKGNIRHSPEQHPAVQITASAPPQHTTLSNQRHTLTYAEAASGQSQMHAHTSIPEDLDLKLTTFLEEFKALFTQLLNQNSMVLSMLTTVINKITL